MKRFWILLFLISAFLWTGMPTAIADTVLLPNGEKVTGRVEYVLNGMIGINTKDGSKSIAREPKNGEIKDIIEVGFKQKKKISGEIKYLDSDSVDILTSSGRLKVNRLFVREINLTQYRQDIESN